MKKKSCEEEEREDGGVWGEGRKHPRMGQGP